MTRSPLAEVRGVIEAPPDRVREALIKAMVPDSVRGEGTFTVEDFPGHTSTVEVTADSIAFQGGWWYRGEWSLSRHPQGTLLVHQVHNVATIARWAVPLANRMFWGFRSSTRDGFERGITDLGKQLGCSVHLT
ncbi:hypothetical protein [Nonomuraea rhizosphaerae]|uniref:hypothetical protein n=1 Tax=Nonomuraea rhizosphaerae TaxID=2665663 RepID=UPI001C5F8F68|nr:hypothetical protein [Nonomuraea rhizosphaerae]